MQDVTDSPFDKYLDLVEAARELGIHPQSLRRLIKQGRVPATLFAGKYLIERDKLEIFKSSYDQRPGRKPISRQRQHQSEHNQKRHDCRCGRTKSCRETCGRNNFIPTPIS